MEMLQCPPEENVLRAISTSNWDDGEGRLFQSYFKYNKGDGISVSRLSVLSREAIIEIFLIEIPKPPYERVRGTVEINVGALQSIGRAYEEGPVELTVVPKPTETNPAHALIPHKITRGLAGKIREYLENNGVVDLWPEEAGGGL